MSFHVSIFTLVVLDRLIVPEDRESFLNTNDFLQKAPHSGLFVIQEPSSGLAAYAKEREKIAAEMARIQATPKTMKQIDDEHSRLYWQRNNMKADINKLQAQLERIEKVQQLEKERDVLRKQQDELQPQNVWQRMTKPNQQQIDAIERDIQRVETLIKGEKRDTPAASEVPNIQKEIFSLQGTLKAIEPCI